MKEKICTVCGNHANYKFKKSNVDYFQCSSCRMIFCDYIEQDGLVGGGAHEERNTIQNPIRIERINNLTKGVKREDVFILDWGAGFGRLVNDLKDAGYINTFGFDPYTEDFWRLPYEYKFDIIVSVECLEHLGAPFVEFDAMLRVLKPGGIVYLESGFLNAAWEDGIKDEDNPYINTDAGHCTIHTHHSIDVLMLRKGFEPRQHVNRHCRIFQKPFKK